jgi:hypothetical protein
MCNYDGIFKNALANHGNSAKWDDAEFAGIKIISNTKVGAVGQDFIELICSDLGFTVEFPLDKAGDRANQSPWDIRINGVAFELKTATEDTNGSFQFNHVRYHRKYDALLCLGVSPSALFFGVWSKADVTTGVAGSLVSMEKNANASYKLTKKPSSLFPIADFEVKLRDFTDNFTGRGR